MKHLLILLISILLFSSFLTSCDKNEETLYRWETSSGWEWKTIGDENDNLRIPLHTFLLPKYKGEVKREYIIFGDYIRDGLGSFTHPNGTKYVGEWKDGKQEGNGTLTFSDGRKYVGEWKDGERNGQGTWTSPDGTKYVGEWKNGISNGQGTVTYNDGRKYVGEFKEGEKWNVTQTDKEGKVIGKWVNGVKQK